MNLTKHNPNFRHVTFRLAQILMGINILEIREIVPCVRMTRVQHAPDFVLGLMNLRGQILTVLDLGVLLGKEATRIHSNSHVFVFKHRDVGFAVDQIGDVVGADPEYMEGVPANILPGIQKYMESIIRLPNEILMILNAKKVMARTRHGVNEEY